MSPVFHASARHWLAGLALAAVGVAAARLLAPALSDTPRSVVTLLGQVIALSGLLVIALGVRRRVRDAAAEPAASEASGETAPPA